METIEQATERIMNEEVAKLLKRSRKEIIKRTEKRIKQLAKEIKSEQKKLS